MVNKNPVPPAEPEVDSPVLSDTVDVTQDHSDTSTVSVSNDDMANFFKPNSPVGQDATGLNGLPTLEPATLPGEKYLPGLEIDFGDEFDDFESLTGSNTSGKKGLPKTETIGKETEDALDGETKDPPGKGSEADGVESPIVDKNSEKNGDPVEVKKSSDADQVVESDDDEVDESGDVAQEDESEDEGVDGQENPDRKSDEKNVDATDKAKSAEVLAPATKEPTLSLEAVTRLAKDTIKSPEDLAKFNEHLQTFEKRAETDKLSKQDREDFYGQVGKVLEASKTGNKFYSSNELQTIASDMVRQAAKPGDVNQGKMSTCTTAALETALYMQEPATIATLVSDIALTGQYVTTDGGVEKIPERNLHPDKYKADTPPEKMRSLASHLAQPALINIHWNRQDSYLDGEPGKKGKIVYEEGHPAVVKGDAHTRLMDYTKTPPEPFLTKTGYSDPTRKDSGIYMEKNVPVEGPTMYMENLPQIYKQLRGNKGDLTIISDKAGPGVIKPDSAEHFKKIMKDAEDRKKPVILGVHANKDPFLTDLNDSYSSKALTAEEKAKASNMHAHHALVATHTEKTSELVTIENQWGNSVDHTGEKGQKAKLSLDTVYDTVIPEEEAKSDKDKEKPAEKQKEPTPDEYIKSQRDFVTELEKDSDSDPQVLFEERMTLHHYLNHWGRNEEAHKQAEKLSSSLADRFKTAKGDKSLMSDATSFVSQMNRTGEKELAKEGLKLVDERFKKNDLSNTFEFGQEYANVMRLHKDVGDEAGAKTLTHDIATNVLEKFGKPEDLKSKKAVQTISSIGDLMATHNQTEETARIANHLAGNVREYEKANGSDNHTVANAKATLMFFGSAEALPEMKKTIAKEVRESYDRLKSKGDISSETSTEMRWALSHFYESTKDPKSLNELAQDTIKYVSTETKHGVRDINSKEFIDIYQHQAERLKRAGGVDYAIPLQEKALKIAMAHKDPKDDFDKTDRIAHDLVDMLDSVGRKEDADKVIKETGIKVRRRAKGP